MEGLLIFATGIEIVVERHAIFYFIFVIIVKRFVVIGGLYLGPCCIVAGREECCSYGLILNASVTVYQI